MALAFLTVFVTLAVAITTTTQLHLQSSRNLLLMAKAERAAESGLAFYAHHLSSSTIADASSGQAVLSSLASVLGGRLNGTTSLGGQSVAYDGNTVTIPAISLEPESSFTASIAVSEGTQVRLTVVGTATPAGGLGSAITRSVSIEAGLVSGGLFGSGMYAKGPISIGNNFDYVGASNDAEASVACAVENGVAISIGSGYIAGDVTHEASAAVAIGATVNGQVQTGDVPEPPEIDGSIYEPFATNIVDASTDTSSGTFTNIRIKAGTNPEFGNGVTILGVMYIEAPNVVYFKNNVDLTAVVVSEDPGPGASPSTHNVYFKNNLTAKGLDELPDTPEFSELRQMGGAAFLLPGFKLEFKNNFSSIGGTMAADQIVTKNNLAGTIYGSIIALGDAGLTFKNNAELTIDRSRFPNGVPGMTGGPPRLGILSSTYSEN